MERSGVPRRDHRDLLGILTGVLASAIVGAAWADATGRSVAYDPDAASSHVTVTGTSTVHDWTVEGDSIRGEVVLQEGDPASLVLTPIPTVHVEISVESLTSDSSGLNRKMHGALKIRTHPTITYRLEAVRLSTDRMAEGSESGESIAIDTKGILTVAGVDRSVDIPMRVKRLPDERLEVSGETPLRMTDFGIDPPTAMLGLLHTGNTIKVRWSWVLSRRDL